MNSNFSQTFMKSSIVSSLLQSVPEDERAAFLQQLEQVVTSYDIFGSINESSIADALQPEVTISQATQERRLPRRQ
jgi:hypothetical protein